MHSVYLSRGPDGRGVLAFEYSPTAIAAVKAVPGREWDKSARIWRIPLTPEAVLQLKTELGRIGWALAYNDQLREGGRQRDPVRLRHRAVRPPAGRPRVPDRLGSGALFWEMGLGKTKTAIDYAEWLAQGLPARRSASS
jgi:hypothetical protein